MDDDTTPNRFSPFDGGPYEWVLPALRLPPPYAWPAVRRRVVAAILIGWVPLVLLAAVQGHALGPIPREAVLFDVAAFTRYVITVPLLLAAELVCLPVLAGIVRRFKEGGFVREADRERYDAAIASTRRLLNARAPAVAMLLLAYAQVLAASQTLLKEIGKTWGTEAVGDALTLTPAGWWLALVSYPLYLLVFYGWLWRLFLWARLLKQISRLDLKLLPTHPDKVGGLGFVTRSLQVLSLVAFALGCTPAGAIANLVLFDGRNALDFKIPVLAFAVLVVFLLAGPLALLFPTLWRARLRGRLEYSMLAWSVGRRLHEKWVDGEKSQADPSALEVPDFSATTDLYQVVDRSQEMRALPFDIQKLSRVAAASLLPFVPVLLTQVPAKQILETLAKLVF
jgi:hypothetical protein